MTAKKKVTYQVPDECGCCNSKDLNRVKENGKIVYIREGCLYSEKVGSGYEKNDDGRYETVAKHFVIKVPLCYECDQKMEKKCTGIANKRLLIALLLGASIGAVAYFVFHDSISALLAVIVAPCLLFKWIWSSKTKLHVSKEMLGYLKREGAGTYSPVFANEKYGEKFFQLQNSR